MTTVTAGASAVYRSASLPERQEMHDALAAATDAQADPDRRAWYRAAAAAGPDPRRAHKVRRESRSLNCELAS
jgi:hypothetical protein